MQAILILAHTAPDHVIRLSKLLSEHFEVYIHFDKKTPLEPAHKAQLDEFSIHFCSEYDVKWGSFSIVEATIHLMKMALENPDITHIHLISGQCWPVISPKEIYDFYENNQNIYMECYSAAGIKKSGEPIILWQKYYYNYDQINRRSTFGKIYHRVILALQTIFCINKFKNLDFNLDIYHGSQWMDLPRDSVEYLLNYFNSHPNVQKVFKTGFCSDEFWAQTILHASPLYTRIVSEYHRYILWQERYGSYPAILDETDFDNITCGDYHFCRKVVPDKSDKLIERLTDNYKK